MAEAASSDQAAASISSRFIEVGVTEFVAETLLPCTSGKYRVRAYRHRSATTSSLSEPLAIIHGQEIGRAHV